MDVLNLAMISVWSYVFTAVRNGRCVVRAGGETDTGKVHMGNYDPNGIGTGQGFLEGNARHEGGAACDAQHATAAQPERGVRVWPSPRPQPRPVEITMTRRRRGEEADACRVQYAEAVLTLLRVL